MPISKRTIWIGRVLSTLAVLFLLFDGTLKFFMNKLPPEALEANAALQWPIEKMPLVGNDSSDMHFLVCHPSNICSWGGFAHGLFRRSGCKSCAS